MVTIIFDTVALTFFPFNQHEIGFSLGYQVRHKITLITLLIGSNHVAYEVRCAACFCFWMWIGTYMSLATDDILLHIVFCRNGDLME